MRLQSPLEERYNVLTHSFGFILGIVALILLVIYHQNAVPWSLFSVIVYGLSVVVLFFASAKYHSVKNEQRKHFYRIIDHISIYLLIAGTYTPVLLILLPNSLGWLLFWIVWGVAFFGIFLKLFFTGKFEVFSTLLYLVMGWLIVFDYNNLAIALVPEGIFWLFAGGLFYTVGIIFYAIEKIPFNHVIWHVFVLAGAICHFLMIFWYII